MLSDEVIEKVTERLVNRIEQGNEYVLQKIGESVKKIGTLSPSATHELEQIMQYGGDYEKIAQKLAKIMNVNVKEIYEIFDEVAKTDYEFAEQFYNYRDINYIPYEENVALKSQVEALARMTANEYVNLTNTRLIGLKTTDINGRVFVKDLRETYIDLMDKAIINVGQGKESFDSAMYSMLKEIGGNGLQSVEFESGKTMRLDSAVRMHLKSGIRNLHNEIQEQIGKEFGADGIEISVHENPADDHAEAQGRQFSKKEYEKLQTTGTATDYKGQVVDMHRMTKKGPSVSFRPISQYNCYHYVFSIVLGVNEPQYSEKQLQQINEKNQKGFTFEGDRYTNYEGTQLQRKLETEIRKQKDVQILAKASDNKELIARSQEKITQLTNKYKQLSNASGLPTYMERMRVSGYKRTKVDKIEEGQKYELYHGSKNIFNEFDDKYIGKRSIGGLTYGKGHYFLSEPSDVYGEYGYKTEVTVKNPFIVQEQKWSSELRKMGYDWFDANRLDQSDFLAKKGYDATIIKNGDRIAEFIVYTNKDKKIKIKKKFKNY